VLSASIKLHGGRIRNEKAQSSTLTLLYHHFLQHISRHLPEEFFTKFPVSNPYVQPTRTFLISLPGNIYVRNYYSTSTQTFWGECETLKVRKHNMQEQPYNIQL